MKTPPQNDEILSVLPSGIDRRRFLIRHAVIGAAAAMTGATWTPEARAAQAAKEAAEPKMGAKLSPDLDVVKKSKGPVSLRNHEGAASARGENQTFDRAGDDGKRSRGVDQRIRSRKLYVYGLRRAG